MDDNQAMPVAEISQEAWDAAHQAFNHPPPYPIRYGLSANDVGQDMDWSLLSALRAALPHLHPPAAPGPVTVTDEMVGAARAAIEDHLRHPAKVLLSPAASDVVIGLFSRKAARIALEAAMPIAAAPSPPAESDLYSSAAIPELQSVISFLGDAMYHGGLGNSFEYWTAGLIGKGYYSTTPDQVDAWYELAESGRVNSPAESDLDAFAAWFDSRPFAKETEIHVRQDGWNCQGVELMMAEAVAQFRASREK